VTDPALADSSITPSEVEFVHSVIEFIKRNPHKAILEEWLAVYGPVALHSVAYAIGEYEPGGQFLSSEVDHDWFLNPISKPTLYVSCYKVSNRMRTRYPR